MGLLAAGPGGANRKFYTQSATERQLGRMDPWRGSVWRATIGPPPWSNMSRPLRHIPENAYRHLDADDNPIATVYVTVDCIQGRFLLAPLDHSTSIIQGVLGMALKRYGHELYAFGTAGNQLELLVGVRSPEQLARIMQFTNSNLSRELGRPEHHDWSGPMFQRRAHWSVVMDDLEAERTMQRILGSAVARDFVERPQDFSGAHCASALWHGRDVRGLWLDRSARLRDESGAVRSPEYWITFQLHRLPHRRHQSKKAYRRWIRRMCSRAQKLASDSRATRGASVLGMQAVKRLGPHFRPKLPRNARAPRVLATSERVRRGYYQAYRRFVRLRKACIALMIEGIRGLPFPTGGMPFPPHARVGDRKISREPPGQNRPHWALAS